MRFASLRFLSAALGVFVLLCQFAGAQQNWRWVNSLPASENWRDVAFGNGVYVAVGLDATIATSPDGTTWTLRRMSTAQMNLNGIAFANGLFVAVGMGTPSSVGAALVMTSTNGSDWTINDSVAGTNNAQLLDVIYGDSTWVISGTSRVLTSPDGLTWTSRSIPAGVIPGTGAFGAGRFVLSGNGNSIITSTDRGVTWTRNAVSGTAGAASPFLPDVAFGSGKFVAVGRDNNFNAIAYTSTDATNWTQSAAIAGGSGGVGFISVASTGSTFVAAGGTTVFSSTDGTTWTQRTSALPSSARQLGPLTEGVSAATAANGQYFVLGIYGAITTSSDGTTWTRRSTGTVNDIGSVLHDGTRFVATGSGGTVLTSTDGTAWAQLTTGSTADFHELAYSGSRYVTAGFSGVFQSTNLTTWTAVAGTTSDRWTAAAYGGGRFIVANSATTLGTRSSVDGATWNAAVSIAGAGGNTNGLVYGANVFVLTMAGFGNTPSKIYTSPDGTGWTQRAADLLPVGTGIFSIAFGNGRFVILTGNQSSLTSTDGITWTSNPLPSTPVFTRIRYLGNRFFATASGYGAASHSSSDGISWTAVSDSFGPNLLNNQNSTGGYPIFATANGTVVAVGPQGMILRGELPAAPVASAAGRLVNMSIRTGAGTGDNTLIVGVALGGAGTSGNKAVLLRGVGPTLGSFGVGGALADPVMTVFQGSTQVSQNDDWAGGFDFGSVGAFAFAGSAPRDAGIYNNAIPTGSYSIQIVGKNNGTGIALAEIYDATPTASFTASTPRLVNVSARTQVGTGDNILIAGFVIGGQSPVRVLVRAVGPTLGAFGVGGTLVDPKLELFSGTTKTAENDNWGGTAELKAAFSAVAAFAFSADTSRDAAIVTTLQPGSYTAQISGVGNTAGVALVEVYELP